MTLGASEPGLWSAYRALTEKAVFTDLTHAFRPGRPHFPGFGDERRETPFDLERGDGFTVHRYTLVGQWGTHVDPPSHFVAGARPLDRIPVEEMILPLVVLDIAARVETDPDATPTLDDVRSWEERNGRIPSGSFVALRTGWSRRWPDPVALVNRDEAGVSHTPGWSAEVLRYLFEDAGVTAIGHEQSDTDPGLAASAGDYSLEAYVLRRDRWQIELLANLDQVPEAGALIVATWPKPQGGSGFPARVFAVRPAE
ncbi:cyclase family protein [Streptomyces purpurascens]|uniref:Cyclase family protein n=1 Tax=Streptomyces purpurascens TaxID=1924 RepID=A0ABZ1MQP5_STREF|nr:cyclase family protein [Streptomyces purpurascens]MCE7045535.1 cyclase family protein [Streptomyces purpurascens]GHA07150.1 cyclase [Streptomyces purpurascens]